MKLFQVQRCFLYLFFFLLNFEMFDLSGSGMFSLGKLGALFYLFSILPQISSFISGKNIKFEMNLLWLFLGIMTVVGFFYINDKVSAFFEYSVFQNILFLLVLCNHERRDPGVIEKGFLAFAMGSFLLVLLAMQGIGVEVEMDSGARMQVFGDNENIIGLRMAVSSVILAFAVLYDNYKLKGKRFLLLIPIPFMLTLLANTGSRVAFVSLVLSITFGFIIGLQRGKIWQKLLILLAASGAGLYLYDFVLSNEMLRNRLIKSSEDRDLSGREQIWAKVLNYISDHLVFGGGRTGYGSFAYKHFGEFASPHNVFLEILVYSGIVGLTLFLLFLFRMFIISYSYFLKSSRVLPLLMLIPIVGLMLSGQLLNVKLAYAIFALALSRKYYLVNSR